VLWRASRARLLVAVDGEGAIRLASEAVGLAAGTADLELLADALSDQTEVLVRVGDLAGAEAALSTALGLYVQKGDESSAAQTTRRLELLRAEATLS
jgi:hypothetical protein